MNTTHGNMEVLMDNITAMENFNEKYLYLRIPAITVLVILFPVGVLGNAFTIYIFGFRLKARIITFFLILIAISDIICCLVGIPMEIHRLFFYYDYYSIFTCKAKAFIYFILHIYSMIVLVMISLERYISVTRSTEKPMNFNSATVLGLIMLILSFLIALPVYTWSRRRSLKLENGVIVYQCVTYLERELWYYILGLLIFYLVNCMMMFALYWFVFLAIRIQNRWNKRSQSEARTAVDIANVKYIEGILTRQSLMNRIAIWLTNITLLIQLISFAYILLRRLGTYLKAPSTSDYFIFLLSDLWMIKCAFNFILYAFFSREFRQECLNIFRGLRVKTPRQNLQSSAENK